MTQLVFISYRRQESAAQANTLRANLEGALGPGTVFLDTATIDAGQEWPEAIRNALQAAHIVLVLVGATTLVKTDEWGRRLIEQKKDWVRREIASALADRKLVLPVLVDDAKLPPAEVLPKPLRGLPARQKFALRNDRWNHDVEALVGEVRKALLAAGRWAPSVARDPGGRMPGDAAEIQAEQTLLRWLSWDVADVISAFGGHSMSEDLVRTLYIASTPDPARADARDMPTIKEAVMRLADMPPRFPGAVEPAIEFVVRAAEALDSVSLHAYVDAWAASGPNHQSALDLLQSRFQDERHARAERVHVVVDLSTSVRSLGAAAVVRYWAFDAAGNLIPGGDSPEEHAIGCDVSNCADAASASRELRRALARVLRCVDARIRRGQDLRPRVVLELFVSDSQMDMDFDAWRVDPFGDDADVEEASEDALPLGVRGPVVVRWAERAVGAARVGPAGGRMADLAESWKRVARRIHNDQALTRAPSVKWLQSAARKPGSAAALVEHTPYGACVGLLSAPHFADAAASETKLAREVLRGGAPYAIWRRRTCETWNDFERQLDDVIRNGRLDELPLRCWQLRVRALTDPEPDPPGDSITILWDDPGRNPLALRLEEPGRR